MTRIECLSYHIPCAHMEGGQVLATVGDGEAWHGCHRDRAASGFQAAIAVVGLGKGYSPQNEARLLVAAVWRAWPAAPGKEDWGALWDPPPHSAGKSLDGNQGPEQYNNIIQEYHLTTHTHKSKRTRDKQGGNSANISTTASSQWGENRKLYTNNCEANHTYISDTFFSLPTRVKYK